MFIGNDTSARVEGIRTFRLLLYIGHFVDLINTFCCTNFYTQSSVCIYSRQILVILV